MPTISYFVPGIPVAKGRPRAYKMHNGHIGTYTPDKTVDWERKVRSYAYEARPATPLEEPLTVCIEFTLLKPKSVAKKRQYPSVKPDLDNLEKAVLDAMNGLIYTDDALICRKYGAKWYTTNASETGVSVEIKTMEGIA